MRSLGRRNGTIWFSAMRELVAAHGRLGNKAAIAPIGARLLEARAEPGAISAQVAALVPAAVHLLYGGDLASAELVAFEIETIAAATDDLEPRARARLHQPASAIMPSMKFIVPTKSATKAVRGLR